MHLGPQLPDGSAHFHEAYDQAAAIDGAPHGYFNMSLFSCPPAELWSAFEDLHECLDIGHANQVHHPLPCREIAADPGPESAVSSAPHGGVRFAEPDAVILVAIPSEKETAEETPDADWLEWSGANRARSVGTYLGATLHEAVETREGGAPAFRRVARVELDDRHETRDSAHPPTPTATPATAPIPDPTKPTPRREGYHLCASARCPCSGYRSPCTGIATSRTERAPKRAPPRLRC